MIRTYSELIQLPTYDQRFEYLWLHGEVGKETFGFDRWLNQVFYRSKEWRAFRRFIILRDRGFDLGATDHPILEGIPIIVHHMNPIRVNDIVERSDYLMNPEYAISTIDSTHKAIHYGPTSKPITTIIERTPNDTCPWRK